MVLLPSYSRLVELRLAAGLAEMPTLRAQLKGDFEHPANFDRYVTDRLAKRYARASQATLNDLYSETDEKAPRFQVTAKWKDAEFAKEAKVMRGSLERTLASEKERLARKYPDDEKRQGIEFRRVAQRKADQLEVLIDSSAAMQAKTDQLVHTGAIDPTKGRVMNFRGPRDGKTCSTCSAVMSGNPYTIDQATTYGHKLHPNCRHDWQPEWEVDATEMAVMKRRIRDGEIKGWDGSGRTPGPLSAKQGVEITKTAEWPVAKRKLVQDLRRRGVPEEETQGMLNRAERERRQKYIAGRPKVAPKKKPVGPKAPKPPTGKKYPKHVKVEHVEKASPRRSRIVCEHLPKRSKGMWEAPPTPAEYTGTAYPCQRMADQELGDTAEAMVNDILGTEPTVNTAPFDAVDHKEGVAYEIKAKRASSKHQQIRMGPEAKANKEAYLKATGHKARTVMTVASDDGAVTELYAKDGFGSFRKGSMTHMATIQREGSIAWHLPWPWE